MDVTDAGSDLPVRRRLRGLDAGDPGLWSRFVRARRRPARRRLWWGGVGSAKCLVDTAGDAPRRSPGVPIGPCSRCGGGGSPRSTTLVAGTRRRFGSPSAGGPVRPVSMPCHACRAVPGPAPPGYAPPCPAGPGVPRPRHADPTPRPSWSLNSCPSEPGRSACPLVAVAVKCRWRRVGGRGAPLSPGGPAPDLTTCPRATT